MDKKTPPSFPPGFSPEEAKQLKKTKVVRRRSRRKDDSKASVEAIQRVGLNEQGDNMESKETTPIELASSEVTSSTAKIKTEDSNESEDARNAGLKTTLSSENSRTETSDLDDDLMVTMTSSSQMGKLEKTCEEKPERKESQASSGGDEVLEDTPGFTEEKKRSTIAQEVAEDEAFVRMCEVSRALMLGMKDPTEVAERNLFLDLKSLSSFHTDSSSSSSSGRKSTSSRKSCPALLNSPLTLRSPPINVGSHASPMAPSLSSSEPSKPSGSKLPTKMMTSPLTGSLRRQAVLLQRSKSLNERTNHSGAEEPRMAYRKKTRIPSPIRLYRSPSTGSLRLRRSKSLIFSGSSTPKAAIEDPLSVLHGSRLGESQWPSEFEEFAALRKERLELWAVLGDGQLTASGIDKSAKSRRRKMREIRKRRLKVKIRLKLQQSKSHLCVLYIYIYI